MKTVDIVNPITTDTLNRLVKEPLPAKASFVISMNLKSIVEIAKLFDEKKQALVDKYATRDSEGKVVHPIGADGKSDERLVTIAEEKKEAFQKELGDLLDVEPELKITKMKPDDLGTEVKLTPNEMGSILWLFE
jgi:hypothetical protein